MQDSSATTIAVQEQPSEELEEITPELVADWELSTQKRHEDTAVRQRQEESSRPQERQPRFFSAGADPLMDAQRHGQEYEGQWVARDELERLRRRVADI